ncbi:MAG TPA: TadE family protein [Frankiaceae bacterium]|nr:TadE family protein [Frankiaceae bacterium]
MRSRSPSELRRRPRAVRAHGRRTEWNVGVRSSSGHRSRRVRACHDLRGEKSAPTASPGPGVPLRRRRGPPDRGYATAELAVALPSLVLVLLAAVWVLSVVSTQARCVEAARPRCHRAAVSRCPVPEISSTCVSRCPCVRRVRWPLSSRP